MKTSYKCVKCFFDQAQRTAELVGIRGQKRARLFKLLTRRLLDFDLNKSTVVYGRQIYHLISLAAGVKDIFAAEKKRIEKELLACVPLLEKFLDKSRDPLHTAARFCCAANAIDFGTTHYPSVKKLLAEIKNIPLAVDHYADFKKKFIKAKTILILADNCGEAVFDRLFIERMRAKNPGADIFYAVRPAPIINDVIKTDALRIGIDKVAKIISSGSPYPGLIWSSTSAAFRKIYRRADLVISKGQGNFEAFEDKRKDIFYLLKVKCGPVSDYTGLKLNSLVFGYNRMMRFSGRVV